MYEALLSAFDAYAHLAILLMDALCAASIAVSAIRVGRIAWSHADPTTLMLALSRGIALALEFKLGGEVIETAVTREMNNLLLVGALILIRCALSLYTHYKIKARKKEIAAS